MRKPLDEMSIATGLSALEGWQRDGDCIVKDFRFEDYDAVIAFVNAVADIARREDHHPELLVGYSTCRVSYTTHDAGGLSQRDFACAAAVDALPAS